MSLRRQLLIASLLLLCLPWAGCQFIREMEGALRQGQNQSLQATADAVAAVLAQREELLYPHPERRQPVADNRPSLYAFPAMGPIIVDGYGDGWEEVPARHFAPRDNNSDFSLQVRTQLRDDYLYLLFEVSDPQVIYHNPELSQEANGDRLVLRLWQGGRRQDYVIATAAPGNVRARTEGPRYRGVQSERIRGVWQDNAAGYSLELEVPMDYTGGRLGFFLINETGRSGRPAQVLGNTNRLDSAAPPWLIFQPPKLQAMLSSFGKSDRRVYVVDQQQWLLGQHVSPAAASDEQSTTFWLLRLLFRSALSRDSLVPLPAATGNGKMSGQEITAGLDGIDTAIRYQDPASRTRTVLSVASPIVDSRGALGTVVVRQNSEHYLSLTDQAFSRLFGYSLIALTIGAVGLLAFASILSWRIGALSHAARHAISEDGQVIGTFRSSSAADEIGELSRQYAGLLGRLKEYNDYLRSLSRKLSHELRTPIAVIRSSLDNLQDDTDLQQRTTYLARAGEGLQRLQHILAAMSEANRLEESIHKQQAAPFDLAPVLREVFHAYKAIYASRQLTLNIQAEPARIDGVADLIVQALDKLMDNAVSFTPEHGQIELRLYAPDGEHVGLQVCNAGPPLPRGEFDHLFEPMVSLRGGADDTVHLGLGLHVVRLIAQFHRGSVHAENLPQETGVAFTLLLPATNLSPPQTPAA